MDRGYAKRNPPVHFIPGNTSLHIKHDHSSQPTATHKKPTPTTRHPSINKSIKGKKKKPSHLSDSLMSSCEVAAEALSCQSHLFFMTFPNCHTYSPSTDCIHIRSINWLYGADGAQGIPTVKGSPDKESGRVLWITLREESYWGLMAALSPMLAYVELQTLPPARTATVTDDISPG